MDVEIETNCYKTVIVIDHGPVFSKLSGTRVDVDGGAKHRSSQSGVGSLMKTMWTIIAEGAIEYCRIVYDVLLENFMVQVIASDTDYYKLNSLRKEEQTISQILKGLAGAGPPVQPEDEDDEYGSSIYPGLEAAATSLLECLSNTNDHSSNPEKPQHGRIIVLTCFKSDKEAKPLVAKVAEIQERLDSQRNSHIDLVLVNVSTSSDKISREKKEHSPVLDFTTMTFKAAHLPTKMSLLARKHYNLRSTSITGIPMKEEQHAGSSANYDVEIIHPSEVHHETYWFCTNTEGQSGIVPVITGNKKDSLSKNVITLKWCTPKNSSNNELLQCVGAYRCTPAEVNSRPAACLISFLQQGRTVLLEQPKRSGGKILSHMLSSHGGDVYIHVLSTGRSSVEDPPSISEGCGGRVTDYRIGDFGKFMKENRLAPYTSTDLSGDETPINRALSRLERSTRHWPMAISETLVFNMSSQLEPLLSHLVKAKLSDDDVQECKKVIYKLQAMESRNDTLPLPMVSMRGKGSKREEQYRQLWAEIDIFIKEASKTSTGHNKVLDCLRGSQDSLVVTSSSSNNASISGSKDSKSSEHYPSQDLAWKELDRYSQMSEHEKKIVNTTPSDPRKRRATEQNDENQSIKKKSGPLLSIKTNSLKYTSSFGPKSSLLSIWTSQMKNNADQGHEDFEGRKNAVDGKTELYQEINKEMKIVSSVNTTSVKEWV